MRVIAGSARSLPLKTLDTLDTRPTQDRIKETLFNILQADLPGCRFLDLFAGSGAIGIEALSRGARQAWFVEKNPKAAAVIRDNLAFTKLDANARVLETDVISGLSALKSQSEPFDILFMDPPYRTGLERQVLEYLSDQIQNGSCRYVDAYTIIIIEASLDTSFDYLDSLGFRITREKRYKTNQHIFVRLKEKT